MKTLSLPTADAVPSTRFRKMATSKNRPLKFLCVMVVLGSFSIGFFPTPTAHGQSASPVRNNGPMAYVMGPLFSEFDFTATVVTTNQSGITTAKLAKCGNMIRSEENLVDSPAIGSNAAALTHVKQMGVDITITLMNLKTHAIHLIYPGKKAYVELQLPAHSPGGAPPSKDQSRIQTSELGRESVAGHPCVKKKWTMTASGAPTEVTVWLATDLKNFPIKTLSGSGDQCVIAEFKDVRLGSPPPTLFVPPPDYTPCASMDELMLKGKQ